MTKTLARTAIVSALLLLLGGVARAQTTLSATGYHTPQTLYFINWEFTKPVGNFTNYIDNTSLKGISFEGRHFLRENVSLGLSFSWNRFDQTFGQETFDITNATVTGPVYRDLSMFAIRAIGHYYLLPGSNLRPYLGAGIGGSWDYAYQQSADLTRSQQNFDFIVSPELGLVYMMQRGSGNVGLNLAVRYTYTTATAGSVKDTQTIGGVLGLVFGY
jgi:hypothetical protein